MEVAILSTYPPITEPSEEPIFTPPNLTATEPIVVLPPPVFDEEVPVLMTPPPIEKPNPPAPVDEATLRRNIEEELQKGLELEISQKKQELMKQLEEMKARARAEAKAEAKAQVEEQVKKTLEAEKAVYIENLKESLMTERMKTEDERLMAQLYAHKLDEKERELAKQDAFFKEHVAKLEAKSAQFYKVTAESFQKGKEDAHGRFARVNITPVCGDLQSQILKCFKENAGHTLSCSGIASAYMQCVDKAKKKTSTGG